jgi:BASS family bile acid:Na+ symporter
VETFLGQVTHVVSPAFAISTMLAMGMRLTLVAVVAPLRNARFVVGALALNFVALPAVAWVIAEILGLDPDVRTGLIVISAVAGAPMIPKLVTIARGDGASAVALVTLLVVATLVVAPLLLPLLLENVVIDSRAIALSLGWQMVLPLAVGVFMHERYREEANGYVDEVAAISNVSLALLLISSIGQNLNGLVALVGSGGILATLLLIGAAVFGGYLLAPPAGVERRLLAIGTAQRNVAAAFIVAVGSFADRPTVLAQVATSGLIMMLVLVPLAGEWSRRPRRFATVATAPPAGAGEDEEALAEA